MRSPPTTSWFSARQSVANPDERVHHRYSEKCWCPRAIPKAISWPSSAHTGGADVNVQQGPERLLVSKIARRAVGEVAAAHGIVLHGAGLRSGLAREAFMS